MHDLIKSGELSNRYGVSTRTLRYYEEMGLIQSQRTTDYAYRMYDDANVKKLEQVLILRKLNISIKDIQRIFSTAGSEVILDVLGKKVDDIDEEVSLLHELKEIIIAFIRQIKQADFSKESDLKLLYDKAKEIETQLIDVENANESSSVRRLFAVADRLEEKAVTKLQIPDNILKRLLQNVYFIWGDGAAVADELGRKYGIFVYHTCENRFKHSPNADPQFQPGLCRTVPDFFAQDPVEAIHWENTVIRDFTPMVIMDLIKLTAEHDKVICENDIDIDSIIHFVTHAVTIANYGSLNDFFNRYEDEIRCRDIAEDEREKLLRSVDAIKTDSNFPLWKKTTLYGVKQIVWEENSTVEQVAEIVAAYFSLPRV